MDEVYRVMGELLKEKSFDQITISDLAKQADVAVGSIYARFKDKNALLAGLYLGTAEKAQSCLPALSSPKRWENAPTKDMLRKIFASIIRFYDREAHILKYAVIAEIPHIDETRASVLYPAIEQFTALLIARAPKADPKALNLVVRVMVRFTTAVMHQSVLIKQLSDWQGKITKQQLLDQLVRMASDLIADAESKRLRSR